MAIHSSHLCSASFSHLLFRRKYSGERGGRRSANRAMLERARNTSLCVCIRIASKCSRTLETNTFLLHIPRRDFFSIAAVRCQRRVFSPPLSLFSTRNVFSETTIFGFPLPPFLCKASELSSFNLASTKCLNEISRKIVWNFPSDTYI